MGFGEQSRDDSCGVREAPRVLHSLLGWRADDDCGRGFVGFDELEGDAAGCVDLALGQHSNLGQGGLRFRLGPGERCRREGPSYVGLPADVGDILTLAQQPISLGALTDHLLRGMSFPRRHRGSSLPAQHRGRQDSHSTRTNQQGSHHFPVRYVARILTRNIHPKYGDRPTWLVNAVLLVFILVFVVFGFAEVMIARRPSGELVGDTGR